MNVLGRIMKYLSNSDYRFDVNSSILGLCKHMPDEEFIRRKFKISMGYELSLDHPKSINEKLQWLKLHDRKPLYTTMVDKYAVKAYVASMIGEEYIIPTLGVWDKFEEIDFDRLPDKFVLKCTHDSGGLILCRDKNRLDMRAARKKLNKSLKRNFYYYGREWPYKDVKPRIIAEQYMEDPAAANTSLKDYKVYTFNGKAKICMINQDRGTHTRADYFDRDYTWLDFTWGYDHAEKKPPKPVNYERMFELAEKLAAGTTELRVDFYEIGERIYFGELTFFDASGFDKIIPIEWDYKLGSMLKLPGE